MEREQIIKQEILQDKKVNDAGLETPKREHDKFVLVYRMKEAREMTELDELTDEAKEAREERIKEGERAVDELMKIYTPAAFMFAKNWIHEDKINQVKDWHQIVYMALYKAIITYDIKKDTQFTTFLNVKVKESCKENKHASTLVSANASAMHKKRLVDEARETLAERGEDPEDVDLLAEELGRDISTTLKRKNFIEMLFDVDQIGITGISTEASVNDESRTIGEQLESDLETPLDYWVKEELRKKISEYFRGVPERIISSIKDYLENGSVRSINKKCISKILKTDEFKELLGLCIKYGVSLKEFL